MAVNAISPLRPPDDVAVVGFDVIAIARFTQVARTR